MSDAIVVFLVENEMTRTCQACFLGAIWRDIRVIVAVL